MTNDMAVTFGVGVQAAVLRLIRHRQNARQSLPASCARACRRGDVVWMMDREWSDRCDGLRLESAIN